MAEPPKPKRPSRSKKAPEPDFSPFEDWLIDGPAGKWPRPLQSDKELTENQERIVAANATLLLNRDAWLNKAQAFEVALSALADEAQQKETRAKYHIRFDRHGFADGDKPFSGYPFPCSISFAGATFGEGNVRFQGIDFRSTTMPASGMVVAGNLYVKSHFPEAVNFSRLDVKGTASFSGSSFAKVPDFTDAKFDRPPEVAGMVVPQPVLVLPKALTAAGRFILWYRGIEDPDPKQKGMEKQQKGDPDSDSEEAELAEKEAEQRSWLRRTIAAIADRVRQVSTSIFRLAADPEDVAKFRKLKSMALAANDHEKDGEFFAGEMLAKRGFETDSFFGLLFNAIYWWLSDFGQSFVRPLLWLGASYLAFAAACLYLIRDTLTLTDRLWFAADFSFRNMLPLFGSLFRFAPAPQDHVSWYQKTYDRLAAAGVDIDRLISLGIAQSLIGTVLLFLFLLALRNRFRLK